LILIQIFHLGPEKLPGLSRNGFPEQESGRFDTSPFDTNSSSEIAKKYRLLQVKVAIEQKNILGEYSSYFKPST